MATTSTTYKAATIAPVLLVTIALVSAPGLREDLQNMVFDSYQQLSPREFVVDGPVRIIDIDDASIARLGQWPWPRTRIAEIVEKLNAAGAAAIGLDVVFSEPDRTSPENLIAALPEGAARDRLADALDGVLSHDARLAGAAASAKVVFGVVLVHQGGGAAPPQKFGLASAGDDPKPYLFGFSRAIRPLPDLEAVAAGLGALNWTPSRDLVLRRLPLLYTVGDAVVPTLAAELLRIAQGASTYVVRAGAASGEIFSKGAGVHQIRVGSVVADTNVRGEAAIRFSHMQPERFVPAWRLLAGEMPASEIEGRIMLVGTSAAGLIDLRSTPVDRVVPGVEVHAQLIEGLLAGQTLKRPGWALGAEFVAGFLWAALMGVLMLRGQPVMVALVLAALASAAVAASWFAFTTAGFLFNPFLPVTYAATVFVAGTLALWAQTLRQRRQVREAFGRFLSPAVVERLAESPERLVLGGEARELTLMFCDLRDFTAMSEGLDAQGVTRFMNEYLTALTDVVLDHRGTVDKYMGDAIMAFWNAPLDEPRHAAYATAAALAMLEALARFNERRARVADPKHSRIARFGIGLATGECSVGNLGSARRFDYSAIGDPVNLASRVEGVTKFYGLSILATDDTVRQCPEFAWLLVDQVRVKGRQGVTTLCAPVGGVDMARSEEFTKWRDLHEAFLSAYGSGDLPAAQTAADQLQDVAAAVEAGWPAYLGVMLSRIENHVGREGRGPWDPVRNMETK